MKNCIRLFSLVVLLGGIAGCGGAVKAPKDARSQNFDVTSHYLDLGGDVYAYVDIEGDVEKAAGLVNELVGAVDEIPEQYKSRFDAVKIAEMLGLADVHAIGMSSYKLEDRYINKSFIKTGFPRTGMLQMFGGEPHPFEIMQLAPKDAVVAFEYDVNWTVVLEAVYAVLEDMLDEKTLSEINSHLDSEIAPGTLTFRRLAEHLDTKVMGAMVIHPTRTLKIPDSDLEVPYAEGFICIDNMGVLMDVLVEKSKSLPLFSIWEDSTWQRLGVAEFLTEELLDYRPVVWRHKATQRVFIATSAKFLEERLTLKDGLETDADFTALAESLPISEGNSLAYVSPRVFEYLKSAADKALGKEPKLKSVHKIFNILTKQISPGQVWMSQNTPDGIYQISNSSFSHKAKVLGALYVDQFYWGSMMVGLFSYIAGEAFRNEPVELQPMEPEENFQEDLEKELEQELKKQYPDEPDKVPEYFREFMERWNEQQKENNI